MEFFKRKINTKIQLSQNSGFTLIETIVAVLVLTISLSALLNLTASSAVTARYSRNDITVNYLLQEVIDFIRNDRDTLAFQGNSDGEGWTRFINKYYSCFSPKSCIIEPIKETNQINECSGDCPFLNYIDNPSDTGFYTYDPGVESIFQRTVKMSNVNPDEIKIEVIINWDNNGVNKSRTMTSNLLNWQVNY